MIWECPGLSDFRDYCKLRGPKIEASALLSKDRRVGILANLLAEQGHLPLVEVTVKSRVC